MWRFARKDSLWTRGRLVTCVVVSVASLGWTASAAPARPIVRDGTVKTADGQLLRGMSLHISKSYSSANLTWGLNRQNLIDVRDSLHMNMIRLLCLDPRAVRDGRPDRAFSTIAEEAYYTDSVIANAGEVGLYIVLNYHCLGMVYDGSTWDVRNFWDFYAPRYKDKTWVLYEILNEPYQSPAPNGGPNDWPMTTDSDIYKNHCRKWAPNTIIMGVMEPVDVDGGNSWANYLTNVVPAACGFSWSDGLNAWSWHPYKGTNETALKAVMNAGVPMVLTENSYFEEGDNNGQIAGYYHPAEWCERNGISWMDWHRWNTADQLATPAKYLIPDAISKGWAWWGDETQSAEIPAPVESVTKTAASTISVQANGRVVEKRVSNAGGAQEIAAKYGLSYLPGSLKRTK